MLLEQYRLRWRYDFSDGITKYGQWDKDAHLEKEKACFQYREGLIRASIEGKNKETLAVVALAECDGWDFVNFAWMMEFRGNFATGSGYHRHVGLEVLTRDYCISVFFDGRIRKLPRDEEDKKYHYAIFGR